MRRDVCLGVFCDYRKIHKTIFDFTQNILKLANSCEKLLTIINNYDIIIQELIELILV